MSKSVLPIAGREVVVSNLDKIWWPDEGIRKGDIIRYYIEIAPWLLPHLQDRPLVLTRYPDGPGGNSFYQKNTPAHAPAWLRTVPLPSGKGRQINYCLIDDVASLVWVINTGGFEIHPFLSRLPNLDQPDYVVFDLDPMERVTWPQICEIAVAVRQALELRGLRSWPKTSGSTGIQIYVPIRRLYTYEQVRNFALLVCQAIHAHLPQITTLERSLAKREGKLYLDYLQNVRGKTLAAVYGVRPRPGAPVSTPLTWTEVAAKKVRPQDFNVRNILQRVQEQGDLFQPVLQVAQELDPAWLST